MPVLSSLGAGTKTGARAGSLHAEACGVSEERRRPDQREPFGILFQQSKGIAVGALISLCSLAPDIKQRLHSLPVPSVGFVQRVSMSLNINSRAEAGHVHLGCRLVCSSPLTLHGMSVHMQRLQDQMDRNA